MNEFFVGLAVILAVVIIPIVFGLIMEFLGFYGSMDSNYWLDGLVGIFITFVIIVVIYFVGKMAIWFWEITRLTSG